MLKDGKYYVGDPCYVLKEFNGFDWDNVLNQTNYFENGGEFTVTNEAGKSFKMGANRTAYGDGRYKDNSGREYPVDAGLLSVIPVEALPGGIFEDGDTRYAPGHIVNIKDHFEFDPDYGMIQIPGLTIDTN